MCQAGPDYRAGDRHPQIAIVGACPGKTEEEKGRPFIGRAGANLAVMIRIINGMSPIEFPSAHRDDYTLLNAHPLPRYRGRPDYDDRPQPNKHEVLEVENIARLTEQIRRTAVVRVLLTGDRPEWLTQTLSEAFPKNEIFFCGHPSASAWNRYYKGQLPAEKIRLWTNDSFRKIWPIEAIL